METDTLPTSGTIYYSVIQKCYASVHSVIYLFILFFGTAAQHGLWPPHSRGC